MAFPGPRTTAALSVVVGAATGLVTGLVTSRWSPALIATLAVLLAAGMFLAVRAVGTTCGRSRVWQTARGGTIHTSSIAARGGGDVTDTACSGGRTTGSKITTDGGTVTRTVSKNGEITDSPINAGP